MNMVDSVGACPYARGVNSILEAFSDSPEEFERLFGFKMFVENSKGQKCFNDLELMIDYYYWGNALYDEAQLIQIKDGKSTIPKEKFIDENGNTYVPQRGSGWMELNKYIQYKSRNSDININLESKRIILEGNTFEQKKNDLLKLINEGNNLSIGGIHYSIKSLDGSINFDRLNGSHWVKITGANEEGILVTSWGKECIIPYDSLLNLENGINGPREYEIVSDVFNFENK